MLFMYWCMILILAGVVSDLSSAVEQGEAFLCFYIGIFCIGTFICFIMKRKSMFCKVNLITAFMIFFMSFCMYEVFVLTNMPPVSFYFVYEMMTFAFGFAELMDAFKVKQ